MIVHAVHAVHGAAHVVVVVVVVVVVGIHHHVVSATGRAGHGWRRCLVNVDWRQ